jgi:transcriptional regulator with XRE-family HTH domain
VDSRKPTRRGEVILARLAALSLSIAEVERRSHLSKNTIVNAIYGPREPQRKTVELLAQALDMPVEELTRTGVRRGGDAPSFTSWLLTARNGSAWIALLGAATTGALLLPNLRQAAAAPAVPLVQFAVLLALLTRLPRVGHPSAFGDLGSEVQIAAAAAGDFRRYWGAAWTFWLFLYLALAAGTAFDLLPTADGVTAGGRWVTVGLNLLQNATTVFLLLCYEVVARPTIEDDLSRRRYLPPEAWLVLAVLLSVLEAAGVGAGLSWPQQQWFGWASGFGQGTALALVVGRLDSKYIEAPAPAVAALYLYAAIQGAWPIVQQHHQLLLVLTFLALVLKCVLFLFVAWLFDSRTLLFYLTRVRRLDDGVERDRRSFLEGL